MEYTAESSKRTREDCYEQGTGNRFVQKKSAEIYGRRAACRVRRPFVAACFVGLCRHGGRSQGVGRLLFPFRQHARRRRGHSCGGRRGYCGTSAGDAVSRGVPCDHGSGEAGTGVGLQAAFEEQDRAHRGVRRRFRGIAQLVGHCSRAGEDVPVRVRFGGQADCPVHHA